MQMKKLLSDGEFTCMLLWIELHETIALPSTVLCLANKLRATISQKRCHSSTLKLWEPAWAWLILDRTRRQGLCTVAVQLGLIDPWGWQHWSPPICEGCLAAKECYAEKYSGASALMERPEQAACWQMTCQWRGGAEDGKTETSD